MIPARPREVLLDSRSPRRARLLRALGVRFRVLRVRCGESAPRASAAGTARLLARRKAAAALREIPGGTARSLLLAADTVVALGKTRFGKPGSPGAARRQLRRLSGRTHEVCTAVALVDTATGRTVIGVERCGVGLRRLAPREIRAYVASGEPLDKAGSYAIQGRGGRFVTRLQGDYYAVVGLPLRLFARLARRFGLRIPERRLARLYGKIGRKT